MNAFMNEVFFKSTFLSYR